VTGIECAEALRPVGTRPRHRGFGGSARCLVGLVLGAVLAGLASPRALAAQDVTCHPGDTQVRRLQFIGNHAYPDEALANAIVTTASSWSRRVLGVFGTKRCLDRAEFPRDRLRLIIFYRNHGYIDVQVDSAVHPVRRGVADVEFRIREGRPVLIDSLTVAGLDLVAPQERQRVVKDLPVHVGGTFDKTAIEQGRDTLRFRLLNAGYPFAEVLRSYSSDTARRVATLTYDVITGPLARIDSVIVRVQPRTPGSAVISDDAVRTVMGLKPGRLYRLNDVSAAQRSLFQTDAFQHISVGLAADTTRRPGVADTTVTVEADLVEGYMHTARAGAGWATLDCFRTQAEFADRDFGGGLRLLRLDASVTKIGIADPTRIANGVLCPQARQDIYSDTLNYNVSASLRSPVLFGAQLNPTVTLFTQRQSEYNAYVRSTPIGASLTLTRRMSSTLSLSPEYRIDLGRTSAQPALYCAVFNLCTPQDIQPLQELLPLAEGGALAVQDRRDDQYNPTRGSLVSVEALVGSQYLGSAARFQFDKGTVDAASYLKVNEDGVIAVRLRLGAVVAQGHDADGFIPPDQRLYAGGPTTVRGFQQNELGPVVYIPNVVDTIRGIDTLLRANPGSKGQGQRVVPEGGNWSVVGNLEYRWRSPFLRQLLQWAFFADVGQVWNGSISQMRGLLWTPGAGVRVFTPVGPIRLDVGYNPYLLPAGAAYFNAPASITVNGENISLAKQVPLYCVSPTNTIPAHPSVEIPQVLVQEPGHQCPATFVPSQSRGFLQKLTFNLSIGQAF
jgi:outer membrane protein insertion porin family/translocation and assembly module TamA